MNRSHYLVASRVAVLDRAFELALRAARVCGDCCCSRVGAGVLGIWIVLRGLAFHAHAVGTATFPGLVLADGLGFAAPLGALGAAVAFALAWSALAARGRGGIETRDRARCSPARWRWA